MSKILFICSSDRTRGPLAASAFAAIAREKGLTDWQVDSAGIRAQHGQMIAPEVRTVLEERGIEPLRIGVQLLTPKLIKASDLLICMTSNQEHELTKTFVTARYKTKTLMSLSDNPIDLFDPNHLPLEKFRSCLELMWPALEELAERLQ